MIYISMRKARLLKTLTDSFRFYKKAEQTR